MPFWLKAICCLHVNWAHATHVFSQKTFLYILCELELFFYHYKQEGTLFIYCIYYNIIQLLMQGIIIGRRQRFTSINHLIDAVTQFPHVEITYPANQTCNLMLIYIKINISEGNCIVFEDLTPSIVI